MKEKLYTIPMNDALNANTECPFCYIEKILEQDALDYVLGSCASYMESDMRELTDEQGFCREHFKKMFDYGNTLGNAWILKTHCKKMRQKLDQQIAQCQSGKRTLKQRILSPKEATQLNSVASWIAGQKRSCYICKHNQEIFDRYVDTFFVLYEKEEEFRTKVKNSKGFCMIHFGDLCEAAETKLKEKTKEEFLTAMFAQMQQEFTRIQEDIDWLVEKFDYCNHDKDWKNSKDAHQRTMQKLKGGFPSEPPYRMPK